MVLTVPQFILLTYLCNEEQERLKISQLSSVCCRQMLVKAVAKIISVVEKALHKCVKNFQQKGAKTRAQNRDVSAEVGEVLG